MLFLIISLLRSIIVVDELFHIRSQLPSRVTLRKATTTQISLLYSHLLVVFT